jgi:molybdate transport system substrate-binding protein
MNRVWSLGLKLVATAVVLGAFLAPVRTCAQTQPPAKTALTVSAAISLKDALEDIQRQYGAHQPAVVLTFNFGASGALQQQIENGAPVDLFVSAGTKQMDALAQKSLLRAGTKRNLLGNQLVLVSPRDSRVVTQLTDLTQDAVKHIAVGEPKSVPVGQYTQETLAALGLADQLKPKLVYAKDVRQVLTYVETGDVAAGFVYTTDARLSARVNVILTVPDNLHSPIIYPAAVIAATRHATEAQAFLDFLATAPARAVFEKFGFTVLAR